MGHHHLRQDRECENCGYIVDIAYCSRCGQKNTETRQSFGYFIIHFIEDFTHYDGAFWKTIKYLLFRPARLTIEYLQGYRQRYVPPVKLYIFISFACFLIIAGMLSASDDEAINNTPVPQNNSTEVFGVTVDGIKYTSVKQLDSVQETLPDEKKMNFLDYWVTKKQIKRGKEIGTVDTTDTRFLAKVVSLLPKVLFIYMPVFAFWLWLFHGKKRWYFFEHGIFTLHYFSFLLLIYTIEIVTESFVGLFIREEVTSTMSQILGLTVSVYAFFYFFRAHRKMYGETWIISSLKSLALFFINLFCILVVLLATFFYISLNL